jgi:hypothetical protein
MTQQNEAAIKSITAALETETGRKIIISKMIALTRDNRELRRKVAEDRIAVHALNNLSAMLARLMDTTINDFTKDGMQPSESVAKQVKQLNMYRLENFGTEMFDRIDAILGDTEGDDLLLMDLIGKQPEDNGGAE